MLKRSAAVLAATLGLFLAGVSPAAAIGAYDPDICNRSGGVDSSYTSTSINYGYVDGFGNYHSSWVYPDGDCSAKSHLVSTVRVPVNQKFYIKWRTVDGAQGYRWVRGNEQPNIDLRSGTKIVVLDIDSV
jgi:hypothetical protein